jgi:uncharacterized protein (DUF1330 family)
MPAFMIFTMELHDPNWLADYRAKAPAVVAKYGGEYVARSTNVEVLEGGVAAPTTAAVLKFPSLQRLKDFLQSDEYRPFKEARQAGSRSVILGFEN